MRRYIVLIPALLLSLSALAQVKSFSIEWEEAQVDFKSVQGEYLKPVKGFMVHTDDGFAPKMALKWEVPQNKSIQDFNLTVLDENALSLEEIGDLTYKNQDYQFQITLASDRGEKDFLVLEIIPLKKTVQGYSVIKRAELSYSLADSKASFNRKSSSPSLLATGDWYEMGITQTGVYKLDRAYLESAGLPVASMNPKNIRVFGYGGGQLPTKNKNVPFTGLKENAIEVVGEDDGSFDQGDYVLFYGQSQHKWVYDNFGNYYHKINRYADTTHYFITVDHGPGARIASQDYSGLTETHSVNYFHDAQFHEQNLVNLEKSGKQWFGEYFDITPSYNFTFSFPNAVPGSQAFLAARAVARSSVSTNMEIISSGQTLLNLNMPPTAVSNPDAEYARSSEKSTNFTLNGDNLILTASYRKNGNPGATAWLDFIEVIAQRYLNLGNQALFFRNLDFVGSGNVVEYNLSNPSAQTKIWALTKPYEVAEVVGQTQGNTLSFKYPADTLIEFVAFSNNNLSKPHFIRGLKNQDLQGAEPVDMVIVAHPLFRAAAEELSEFHLEDRGLSSLVVSPKEIYNEFSSGAQDLMAIRMFMKHLYDQAGSPEEKPKYLLLFGDASYDYKNRVAVNHNFVPSYSAETGLALNMTDITDDFYGYLDPDEGSSLTGSIMDLAIGRLPVKSAAEASGVVNKIKIYQGSQSFGEWRNNVLFVADDVDDDWEHILVKGADNQAVRVDTTYPNLNVSKIYLDAYEQVSTAAGDRYPDATQQMLKAMERGLLLVNYIGHGGELGWADEGILNANDVNGFTNLEALNVLVTITCEFTRFDDPDRTSAGERMVINPNGGSIGIFSTTRQVGATSAISLGNAFYRQIFERENGQPIPMGEAMRRLKNDQLANQTKLDFSFFGDPSLPMASPTKGVRTTAINEQPLSLNSDTINALEKVKIQGVVTHVDGSKADGFNGVVVPVVFDKYSELVTLNNDGQGLEDDGYPISFQLQKNILYKGKAEVVNGEFSFEFVVPKDIAYQIGQGRISYYAFSEEEDAAGAYDSLLIGGSNPNPPVDNEGPQVQLYMNDESFVFGGLTDDSPKLLAKIFDENGVNTVGNGIGHDLSATLDDESESRVVLNEFYEADLNSYQSGSLEYPFSNLSPGRHTLELKVWDVHNNSSTARTEFVVAESARLALDHVLNYPNPFTTYTEFHFEHNRPGEPLDVQVQVFTVSGKLVKTIQEEVVSSGYRVNSITWDGLDDFGDMIGKGVYVYKVKVRAQSDNSTAEEYEKLVILR